MHGLHLAESRITGQRTEHAQSQLIEQRQDVPEFTGDVVFADQADVVDFKSPTLDAFGQWIGFAPTADALDHGFTGDAAAEIFRSIESSRVDGDHRRPPAPLGVLTHGYHIIAGQCGHAGVVDEYSGGLITVDGLLDRMEQAFFAASHDDVLLG